MSAFIGIGVGPGDPELITVKAINAIGEADTIAFVKDAKGQCRAYDIASRYVQARQHRLTIVLSMGGHRDEIEAAYDRAAASIRSLVRDGQRVAFLCEGDPLLFGSYIYLHQRLSPHIPCLIVPGITALSTAAAATGTALASGNQTVSLVSGRNDDCRLANSLLQHHTTVIYKVGKERDRILNLLQKYNNTHSWTYVSQASTPQQKLLDDFEAVNAEPKHYFSLLIVQQEVSAS